MLLNLGVCFLLATLIGFSNAVHQDNIVTRGLSMRLHVLDPPVNSSQKLADDEWFEQRLDHFDALNGQKWAQRYFSRYVNANYWIIVFSACIISILYNKGLQWAKIPLWFPPPPKWCSKGSIRCSIKLPIFVVVSMSHLGGQEKQSRILLIAVIYFTISLLYNNSSRTQWAGRGIFENPEFDVWSS